MRAIGEQAAVQTARVFAARLRGLVAGVGTDTGRLAVIAALEQVASAVAAAQVELTAAYATSIRAAEPTRPNSPHEDRVDVDGHAIDHNIARAKRISPARAAHYVHFATNLTRELPHTLDALYTGHLNERRAQLLHTETTHLSVEHRRFIDHALCGDPVRVRGWGDRQLRREAVSLGCQLDAQAAVHRRKIAETARRVTLRPAADQMAWLTALLPWRDAVGVYKTLDEAVTSSRSGGDQRSRGQIMADTLTSRLLTTHADVGQVRWNDPPVLAPTPPALPVSLHLIITDHALLTGSGVAWLEDEPLPAADLAHLLDPEHGEPPPVHVRRVFTDAAGRLVALESASRCFPDGLAELIRLRDRTCRTPYCDAPIQAIDHLVSWANGGPTTYPNSQGLCTRCNNTKEHTDRRARHQDTPPRQAPTPPPNRTPGRSRT